MKKKTSDLEEKHKTCGKCAHKNDLDITGSVCYLCKRNATDNRIDWFEMNNRMKGEIGNV